MMTLAQNAIDAALRGNWKEAEKLNAQILEDAPEDSEALNRLARAALELGKTSKALTYYRKVKRLDPYNTIANKAIERLKNIKSSDRRRKGRGWKSSARVKPKVKTGNLFIEEPGKTKTISLIHLGGKVVLNKLDAGEVVYLAPHRHRISVETADGEYIGRLPDDIGSRLIKLIRAGNRYEALVRSIKYACVKIFVKEIARAKSTGYTLSFPNNDAIEYVAFTPPELVHSEKPNISSSEGDVS